MSRTRPFLITIDTEGDNVWSKPRIITTRNAAFLPRFQTLCERYGLTPTWLVDYDMARDPVFAEFGRDVIARGAGEIGMHLHAWRTPPGHPLTSTDHEFMPFLIEYPESVLRAKVDFLTDLLETTFGVKIVSHRAGRWAFNDTYARALARRGFRVDCSVTPGVDWSDTLGDLYEEHSFIGVRTATLSQEGFFEDGAGSAHEALTTGPGVSRVLCYGLEGSATGTGAGFEGWAGAVEVGWKARPARGGLTKALAS